MDGTNNGKLVTEQGVGTPVPVGNVGERVGPTRPLSSDYSALSVGSQAEVLETATGRGKEEVGSTNYEWIDVVDPFARRSSLSRSPPGSRRGSVSSVGSGNSTTSKRRRAKDEGQETVADIKAMLEKLQEVAKEAQATVKAIPNTKTEIKKAINAMTCQIEAINRKIGEWDPTTQITKAARVVVNPGICVGTQTDTIELACMAVQTMPFDVRKREEQEREMRALEEIHSIINAGEGRFEELGQILDKHWPEGAFKTIQEVEGNPFKSAEKKNIILLIDPKQIDDKGVVQDAMERFPEIRDILADGCIEGKLEFIINETRTSRKSDGKKDRTTVYILPYTIDKNGVNDMQGVFDLFLALRNETSTAEPQSFAMVTSHGLDRLYVRKIAEFVMRGKCLKVEYFSTSKKKPERRRGSVRDGEPKERQQRGNVIVKAGARGYAELLKTVKDKIDVDKMGISVKNLRKTASGDLLLNTANKGMAELLGNAIREQLSDSEVIVRKGEKTLLVMDVDGVTSKEEISAALERAAGPSTAGHFVVGDLRSTRNGNRTATVTAPKTTAELVVRMGKIRIGLVSCRVVEKVRVQRCLRCLDIGHSTKDCGGADLSDHCLNCCQKGHKAKECKNRPHCPKCNTNNHRVDSIKCPHFRRQIEQKQRGLKTRRSPETHRRPRDETEQRDSNKQ